LKWIAVAALAVMAGLLVFGSLRRDSDDLADELHRRWVKPGADAAVEENLRQVRWRNEQGSANRFGFPPIAAPFKARLDRASGDIALEPPWAFRQLVEFLAANELALDAVTQELLSMDEDRDGHASPPVSERRVADILEARAVFQLESGDRVGAERSLEAAYIAEPWDTSEPYAPAGFGCLRRIRPSDPIWQRRLEAFNPLAAWDARVAETISGLRGEWQWCPTPGGRLERLESRLPFGLVDAMRQNAIDVPARRHALRDVDHVLGRLATPSFGCVTEAVLTPLPQERAAHTAFGLQHWRVAALRELADATLTRAVLQAEQGPCTVTSTTCDDIQVEVTRDAAGWTCSTVGPATRLRYGRSGPTSYTFAAAPANR
jgi:hypothetical protein